MLIQILCDDRGIGVRHHTTLALAPINYARVLLGDRLVNTMVMVNLQLAFLVCCLKSILELSGYPFLAKLLFDAVDDGHDSLNVSVENVANLEALESYLAIVLLGTLVRRDDRQASFSHIVDDWR